MIVRRLLSGEAEVWRQAVDELVDEAERDGELVSSAETEAALSDDRCYMLVAQEDDKTLGFVSAYRFPDLEAGGQIVYLYDIEVASSRRKEGIGALLVESLVSLCDEDDVDLVWAGTEAGNDSARALFAKTGATLEGETYVEYEWDLEVDE